MNAFEFKEGVLNAESVSCELLAGQYGTPLYVYSRAAIVSAWKAYETALSSSPREHLICYAVKANSNLAILNVLARLGSGFDIVSIGELERVLTAGGDPSKIVFSGVGKREVEIARALEVGIHCFNIESLSELERIQKVATRMSKVAPVSFRINPDVDAKTHPYISTGLKDNKFGISMDDALDAYRYAAQQSQLKVVGIDCHIGSQLTDIAPYIDALSRLLSLADQLEEEGITLEHIDLGGGQGVCYKDETPIDLAEWANSVNVVMGKRPYHLVVEPGRAIVANAGVLLTQVEYLKHSEHKNFAIVDAAMNDLIRPSLYSAWQRIGPVIDVGEGVETKVYDVVGPVCESTDFLGKDRELAVAEGDLLAVHSAGAYAYVMSSNYNTRPRAAEVLVDGVDHHLVRRRENVAALFNSESIPL